MSAASESNNSSKFEQINYTVSGFITVLGLEFQTLSLDKATAQLHITEHHYQPNGIVHGGVYCSIVETLGSVAGTYWLSNTVQNAYCVGVHNSTDFLRPASSGILYAVTVPLHRGKSQQLWQVNITDDSDRLMSQGQLRVHNIYPQQEK